MASNDSDTSQLYEPKRVDAPIRDIVRGIGRTNTQTLVIGDNHDDNVLKGFVADDDTISSLSRGFRHLNLELPVEQEGYLREYLSGGDRDAFIDQVADRWGTGYYDEHARERAESTADIVDRATRRGMIVHFSDDNQGVTEQYSRVYKGPLKNALDRYAQEEGLTKREVGQRMSHPEYQQEISTHILGQLSSEDRNILREGNPGSPSFAQRRLSPEADRRLGQRIEEQTNGEPRVVFYGREHNIEGNVKGNSVRINLVDSADAAESNATGFKTPTTPDFVYSVTDNVTFQSPHSKIDVDDVALPENGPDSPSGKIDLRDSDPQSSVVPSEKYRQGPDGTPYTTVIRQDSPAGQVRFDRDANQTMVGERPVTQVFSQNANPDREDVVVVNAKEPVPVQPENPSVSMPPPNNTV